MTDDDPAGAFRKARAQTIESYPEDAAFQALSADWMKAAYGRRYMYNWEAFGRPVIQLPADMMALSEIIWMVKPDLIVETGIAHGGSVVHSAAQLALLDLADATAKGELLDPLHPKRRVVAVDIDIRAHNRAALEAHPLKPRITLIEGSSVDAGVIAEVHALARGANRVMVCLDSNHTHDHVLAELCAYAPLTSRDAHCVVFDTIIEALPRDFFPARPWNPGDSPRTAIDAYMARCARDGLTGVDGAPLAFVPDRAIEEKLILTAAPGGFLRRT
ncbi:CmcI family methyltransferase [Acuticoccus sp. MNP-M23]|uniref:cephalosporin hydroxylase family protein n=1 Tax=Acuticoccus sp. MNP-M23 TaxID=3072793 RepID=UPI00281672D9|nr:CmcI family methyltransferase [Acuticoccus sp. MNP-M23]WMS43023.1 CmcI family methyltransferase [Acuticoccus sp. MNP-M23]